MLTMYNQRQTEWKNAPLAKVRLCKNGAFAATSRLYAKFDCPVARQNLSVFTTAHDYVTG